MQQKSIDNDTYENYLTDIIRSLIHLSQVPEKFRTKKLCEIAVGNITTNLKHIPKQFFTYEMCKLAIINNGYALEYVPEEFKTEELCLIAISNCAFIIQHIPEKCLTEKLLITIIQKFNGYGYRIISKIPKHLLTKNLCELAIILDGKNLEHIPDQFKTEEICKIAVETESNAGQWAPVGSTVYNNYIMNKALM